MLTIGELEAVEQAHRAAQARVGVMAGLIARDEWMTLNPANPSRGSYGLMMRLLRFILGLRSVSRRLTRSYYRLARALETGYTLDENGEATTLDDLRGEFEADLNRVKDVLFDWDDATAEEKSAAEEARSLAGEDRDAWNPGELSDALEDWLSAVDGDGDVKGEKHAWDDDRIKSVDDARKAFQKVIGDNGITDLEQKIRALKRRFPDDPDRLLAELDNAFLVNRDLLAGTVDKAVMDGGRELSDSTVRRDRRARLVARGTGGNPCHFCAMLASRGFVYASERAAVAGWHPNCHCYAITRWSDDSPLPESNAYYQAMWDKVTGAYYGQDKVKAWRKWLGPIRVRNGGKL